MNLMAFYMFGRTILADSDFYCENGKNNFAGKLRGF